MTSLIRELLKNTYIECVAPFKQVQNKLTFLYGHHMGVESVDQNQLHDVLKKINRKVAFIDFEEACELVERNVNVRSPVACFSFDDGFEEVISSIVPVLDILNTNCCIFINPAFIDSSSLEREEFYENRFHLRKPPAGWDELANFANNGGVIGSHTKNHLRLSNLDDKFARSEIVESKLIIEEKLNIHCNYFAWPYGTAKDITVKQLELAQQYYRLTFSAIRSTEAFYHSQKIINRDHFEGNWRYSHIRYFLTKPKNLSCLPGTD